jgi:Zn-dependent protease with chaperone function
MDFLEAQDVARRRTTLLVVLFIAAVVLIILIIYIVVHYLRGPRPGEVIDPVQQAVVEVGVVFLVGLGSGYRTLQLRRGGPAVAELLGGRRVEPTTTDPAERRLVNVVEEMAIASNIPVPAIYVLDDEEGINAFAAGHSPTDAAVTVTRGTLQSLTRDELQGVVAHEFSHIFNGDMRLNLRLMGLLFGLLLLAVVGRIILYAGPRGVRRGGRRQGGGGQIVLIGLALLLVGYIGVFFGRLIQAAISRQREYLADASAVQFTRNPRGLEGALIKIGASTRAGGPGGEIRNAHAEEANHFFFARGIPGFATRLFASHPPLVERIQRIDPSFDGNFELPAPPSRGTGPAHLQ